MAFSPAGLPGHSEARHSEEWYGDALRDPPLQRGDRMFIRCEGGPNISRLEAWLIWHVGSQPARTAQLDFLGGTHTAESGWTSPYIAAHPNLHDCRRGGRRDASRLARP